MEQVLDRYGIGYREFRPLLIDTDTQPESLLDEDDAELVLGQISQDLNFLIIATERPAYFSSYIERMYEETGLIVQLEQKGQALPEGINLVLDMEQDGGYHRKYIKEQIIYLPLYKRPWVRADVGQNLDISIPIGYNTMIVKG
ncbi:MAG: hypothetical protein HFH38_15745 [Lachnospiraceae bacterium]|nr:hypothetical protein [Lachnospiraceae bacterium]